MLNEDARAAAQMLILQHDVVHVMKGQYFIEVVKCIRDSVLEEAAKMAEVGIANVTPDGYSNGCRGSAAAIRGLKSYD